MNNSKIQVKKAVIPVAGFGSRMLPITKSIEKCMLPIINRPIIDYIVEDCINAGIEEIIFVVSEHSSQIKDYYGTNKKLENYLQKQGKTQFLELVKPNNKVKLRYIIQKSTDKYGTAIPVELAYEYIKQEDHVLVLMGDDFLWSVDRHNDILGLIQSVKHKNDAALIGVQIDNDKVSNYGVIEKDKEGYFKDIIEKPTIINAPSNLINVSKYILPKSLINKIIEFSHSCITGEYIIVEPINQWVKEGGKMHVYNAKGKYLDGGNPKSWLAANNFVAHNS